ncbi:divergent protein kinase domain 2A [Euwallacea similis]|uniref:divergent protein kinase domain 2A n=1 Tax=Euwallacea similis TaxID=1736056 RepID=UPI00344FAD69
MKTAWDLSEIDTCPWCFGLNYCAELQNNTTFQYDSLNKVVFNLFSVKNVYFARSGETDVVIKKLIDKGDDFTGIRSEVKSEDLIDFLVDEKLRNFQVCSLETAQIFLKDFSHKIFSHLWTLLNTNVEPLLLEIFPKQENWPVPHLLGYCGRTVIEENCGAHLNDIENLSWHDRAYVALQLLEVSLKFTFEHAKYRLYLTDISPDNIAVNVSSLKVSVVDLENAVLQRKVERMDTFHYTQHSSYGEYAFSKSEICSRTISDHNIYSVCMLLLSPSAPYPMMSGGLLHSPPSTVDASRLFAQIELCVYSTNHVSRFLIVKQIEELITSQLHKVDYYNKH